MDNRAQRNLWIYSLSGAVSRFGTQFQFMAVTSLTYAVTGSPLLTALQMSVVGLPFVLLAKWAGAFADKYDPRRLTAWGHVLQAVLVIGYTLSRHMAVILLLNFLVSSVSVFIGAARASLIPQMVGRQQLFAANARLASINGAAQLLAPGLAGSIVVHIGPNWAFLFNSISYLAPAIAMAFIREVEVGERAPAAGKAASDTSLRPAWQFLRGQRSFLAILAGFAVYTFGMWSINGLFYPYTEEVLGAGPDVFGWTVSAYFGAFLITGVALERWGNVLRSPKLLAAGFLLGPVIWNCYSLTNLIPVALLLSAFDGIVYTFTSTRINTWVQEDAPAALRGRVAALVRGGEELSTIIGQLSGGAIATFAGVLAGIRVTSLLTLGLLACVAVASLVTARQREAATRPA